MEQTRWRADWYMAKVRNGGVPLGERMMEWVVARDSRSGQQFHPTPGRRASHG